MTPPVLAFLRDTRVGEFISLAALGGGREVEEADPVEEEGEELRPPPWRLARPLPHRPACPSLRRAAGRWVGEARK